MPVQSGCPLATALDLFGDRWTLRIVQDLISGPLRFKDFTASIEGIPTNILTERLNRLVEAGSAEKVPVAEGSKRFAYQLTPKGRALEPIIAAIIDWSQTHHSTVLPESGPPAPSEAGEAFSIFEEPEHFADLG